MSSKRRLPAEYSTSASSSSASSEENEVKQVEEEEVTTTPPKHPSKKPNPPSFLSKSHHASSSSSSSDDSYAAATSDSDPPPTQNHTAFHVTPTSSKPKTPSLKPPLETDDKGSPSKKKKKVSDLAVQQDLTGKKSPDDHKKLFQRLWTDQDEIVILKGMISFKKKGMDPSAQVTSFFGSIKNSLRPDVNKSQLHSKIRTLKRKYYNAVKKANKAGQDPQISKPHEEKVFHLSNKVWGREYGTKHEEDREEKSAAAASVSENQSKTNKIETSPGPSKVAELPNGSPIVVGVKQEECDVGADSKYTYLNQALAPQNLSVLPGPPPGLVEIFSKKGWNVIGGLNAKRFDKSWKDVMIAETKAYLQRVDLVREQTQAMLDVLESSNE